MIKEAKSLQIDLQSIYAGEVDLYIAACELGDPLSPIADSPPHSSPLPVSKPEPEQTGHNQSAPSPPPADTEEEQYQAEQIKTKAEK